MPSGLDRNLSPGPPDGGQYPPRLNLLLTYGGWRERPAVLQLPQLLEPLGIRAMQAETGDEAARIIGCRPTRVLFVHVLLQNN